MPEPQSDSNGYLNLPESPDVSAELLETEVQRAQDQLTQLRRQQEQIERQKRDLEELKRRQDEFQDGREEMMDKLARALPVLERETVEAERRVELLRGIDAAFRHHLSTLETMNPKAWDPADLGRELSRALSAVDDAKSEYAKSRSKIVSDPEGEGAEAGGEGLVPALPFSAAADPGFVHWLKCGFAFTLPLLVVVLVLIALVVALWASAVPAR